MNSMIFNWLRFEKYTKNKNKNFSRATYGKLMLFTQCAVCNDKKKKILKNQETKVFFRFGIQWAYARL